MVTWPWTQSAPLNIWLWSGPSCVPTFPAEDLSCICIGIYILAIVEEMDVKSLLPDLVSLCISQMGSFQQLVFNFVRIFFFFLFIISTTGLALEFWRLVLSCCWAGWAVSLGIVGGPYVSPSPRSCPGRGGLCLFFFNAAMFYNSLWCNFLFDVCSIFNDI